MSRSGWLAIDKPSGYTSHDVVAIVRKRLGIRKIGHSGTLDPNVTGVLLLAVGHTTRLIQFLQPIKAYHAVIGLGRTTTTQDASGEVLSEHPIPSFNREQLRQILAAFQGEQWQTPPMVSAVFWQGKRLYQWARQGVEIAERPARKVTIDALTLGKIGPDHFELQVTCSSGTYIRTLAHDIGGQLGCGAYLQSMRRTMTNGIDSAVALDQVTHETALLALDAPLQHLPTLRLTESDGQRLCQGQTAMAGNYITQPGVLRLYAPGLIGIGEWSEEGLRSRVILDSEVRYPSGPE